MPPAKKHRQSRLERLETQEGVAVDRFCARGPYTLANVIAICDKYNDELYWTGDGRILEVLPDYTDRFSDEEFRMLLEKYDRPELKKRLDGFKFLVTEHHSPEQLRMIAESTYATETISASLDTCLHKLDSDERIRLMQIIQSACRRQDPPREPYSSSQED